MSAIIDFYNLQKQPNQSIAVVQCGLTNCHSGHCCDFRIYNHYSIHFILEGKGTYTLNGKTYSLGPGEGFMIFPGISNSYTADISEPWKYIYATFYGIDDASLVHKAGIDLDHVTFTFPENSSMRSNLYAMYEASMKNDSYGYDVTGYFLLCMSQLVKNAKNALPKSIAAEQYVREAINFIENNYPYDINVHSIASYIGIERSYLYKIFMKYVKKSPSSYLYEYRLLMATKLLENADITIQEIAFSTGFHDAAHFYKIFAEKHHITPKQYRISVKEQTHYE